MRDICPAYAWAVVMHDICPARAVVGLLAVCEDGAVTGDIVACEQACRHTRTSLCSATSGVVVSFNLLVVSRRSANEVQL